LETLVRSTSCAQAAEWLNSYVVAHHPERESLRVKWMKSKEAWTARAGWHLTASLVNKGADSSLDLDALLDRIEKEMAKAEPEVRWTMNNTLMAIGIKHAEHRARAIAIGGKIGLYADWPVSKGCVIPFAPVAIEALTTRKK
jgi:3-methyladenine DNA glycosylase AlkD